jgi:murein DD-endopeptidase MepM/ murein hydrolase activator NlpD
MRRFTGQLRAAWLFLLLPLLLAVGCRGSFADPENGSTLTEVPVSVRAVFPARISEQGVVAQLNGRDVSGKFSVSGSSAVASLEVVDGLRILQSPTDPASSARNILILSARSAKTHFRFKAATTFLVDLTSKNPSDAEVIGPDGGILELDGFAEVQMPAGSFPGDQRVTAEVTATAETATDYDATAFMFGATTRSPYEIRVNTGPQSPLQPVVARLTVPSELLELLDGSSEIQVLAQVFQDGGEEVIDSFELFESIFDPSSQTVEVELPPAAFTNRRRVDESYEAVILLVVTPTGVGQAPAVLRSGVGVINAEDPIDLPPDGILSFGASRAPLLLAAASDGTCQGSTLGAPLDGTLEVTSEFNGNTHFGTDYRANGANVRSMADGVVERVGFDERPLTKPDPRSGKLVKGWGRYVVVRHVDGSRSLYAHLEVSGTAVTEGATVSRGDLLAISDNSGGSEAPHLHVEYAPNGKIYERASKADPNACIGRTINGSITVRDNGSLADDAFLVAINGLTVCQTAIGASNTCAVGNLRPGTATLALTVVIAPDDIGTFEVTLANGITFSDGTTSRSGSPPQGATVAFTIVIPNSN